MDRVGLVFLLCIAIAVVISLIEDKGRQEDAIDLDDIDFRTSGGFNLATLAVSLILVGLYAAWW